MLQYIIEEYAAAFQSNFSLKCFAFQTIRPVVSRKNVVFPLTLGRAALCRLLSVLPF